MPQMSSETASITVLIPIFNRGHLLPRAVNSVLQESRVPITLRIVDASSTDEAGSYVRELMKSDPRVRYIRHSENTGGMPDYRVEFESLETSFFLPLEEGGVLEPDFLSQASRLMAEMGELGAVVYCGACRNENGEIIRTNSAQSGGVTTSSATPESHLRRWMSSGHYLTWSSILWRRDVLRHASLSLFSGTVARQMEFQMRVFFRCPVAVVNKLGAILLASRYAGEVVTTSLRDWATIFKLMDRLRSNAGLFHEAEYSRLRMMMQERYRCFWNAPLSPDASDCDLLRLAVLAGFRLGDWSLSFDLIDRYAAAKGTISAKSELPHSLFPATHKSLSNIDVAFLAKLPGGLAPLAGWLKILVERSRSLELANRQLEESRLALSQAQHALNISELNRKSSTKHLKRLHAKIPKITKGIVKAVQALYSTSRWKWGRYMTSPFKRGNRKHTGLESALSKLRAASDEIKKLDFSSLNGKHQGLQADKPDVHLGNEASLVFEAIMSGFAMRHNGAASSVSHTGDTNSQ